MQSSKSLSKRSLSSDTSTNQLNNIILYISTEKYDEAIKDIKKYLKEIYSLSDIISTTLTGLIYLKSTQLANYMINLTKLNSYTKKEKQDFEFLNCAFKMFQIIYTKLFEKTPLNILFSIFDNKHVILNYHFVYIMYLLTGIIYLDIYEQNEKEEKENNNIKLIISKIFKNEKCSNCILCNNGVIYLKHKNINVIKFNNHSSVEKKIYRKEIRVQNNCVLANKLNEDFHLISEVKRSNDIFSFQNYISNTSNIILKKNNKKKSDNKKIYLTNNYVQDKKPRNEISKMQDFDMYIKSIRDKIKKTQQNFEQFKYQTKEIKNKFNLLINNDFCE